MNTFNDLKSSYAMLIQSAPILGASRDTLKHGKLHFDIAQKNTIMWGVEDDIPLMLKNRIKATIE